MKIHLFGASGSGVTTTGQSLGAAIGFPYLDTDAYYWLPTEPPFQEKRPAEERNGLLLADLDRHPDWILGGSAVSWGDFWLAHLDLAVFLWIPPALRMERLKQREFERYGEVIYQNPDRHRQYEAFMAWAAQYDDPGFTRRSRTVHKKWMGQLACPVLRLEGNLTIGERVELILRETERLKAGNC